jgi:hypothetical protein
MSFFLTFLGFDLTPPRPFPHGGSLEHYGEGIQRRRESAEIRAWLAIYPPSPPVSTTPRTTPPLLPIDHLRELREPTPPLSPIDHTSPVTPIWAYHLFTPPPPPPLGTPAPSTPRSARWNKIRKTLKLDKVDNVTSKLKRRLKDGFRRRESHDEGITTAVNTPSEGGERRARRVRFN